MTTREMGIEEARPLLGDLVRDAQQHGMTTHITRNGKPAAVLMPDGVNMYLLERVGDTGYDEVTGFVVAGVTDVHARQQAAEQAGDEGKLAWLSPDLSTCEVIGTARRAGVIACNFRAG